MSNGVFNIAKGAVAEKVRDGSTALLILLLKVSESDANLVDRTTVAAILAASNTEADFTNYSRKTAITGTVTVDNSNDRVDVDVPDQTWTAAGGASNNSLSKLILAYEESASDSGRIPLTHHDFAPVTDGSDLTAIVNAAGFFRAT